VPKKIGKGKKRSIKVGINETGWKYYAFLFSLFFFQISFLYILLSSSFVITSFFHPYYSFICYSPMTMNPEKLAKLQSQVRIGGKGTSRRKVKKVHKSVGTDDKKLQSTLKKLNVQPIAGIEEVNMFKSDGTVIHFTAPKSMSFFVTALLFFFNFPQINLILLRGGLFSIFV